MNVTDNVALPAVTPVIVGAEGTETGVPDNMFDSALSPTTLSARIRTREVVPFVRPVISRGDPVPTGLRVVQVAPLLVEYS